MDDYIVVFTRNIDKWGAERSTVSLCKGLKEKGYNVLVIIPAEGPIIDLLNEANIEFLIQNYSGWIYQGKHSPRKRHLFKTCLFEIIRMISLRRKFRKYGMNPILIYDNTLTFGFGAILARSMNVIFVQHIRENLAAFDYHLVFGYKRSMTFIDQVSSAIICTCNTVRKCYEDVLSQYKTFTVYNGVPSLGIIPDKDYKGILRIIQVARFMDDKRIIDTLHAFDILKREGYDDIVLDIYGKGEEEQMYRDYIKEHNLQSMVHIKGFVQKIDFSPYLVGLMTSTFEAFARSVLDYMNNGLAVIASNAGGNTEQIVNGETGILYNVKNSRSLADSIIKVYKDRELLERLAKKSRERFLSNFTQDKYVSRATQIIINQLR